MAEVTLAQCQAFFRAAPFVADIGIQADAISTGECHTSLVLHKRHLQHSGQVHAGVLTTLADHTAGAAAQTTLAEGAGLAITAELKLSLLRAARGDALRCVARVLKPGRRLVFVEAEVFCRDAQREQLVAKLSATMAVVSTATT